LMREWAWNFNDLRAGVVQTEKERYDVGTLESIREFHING